jgi:hypothetical protein
MLSSNAKTLWRKGNENIGENIINIAENEGALKAAGCISMRK